ncbi:MAG TPA: GNAT family N-acetyltransferase [Noviherbaspirillum sp.]|uniref:GNAT family N-acetyltransferase n=1 Tax=Noviherbaspirillum sp. TaxID=1926288 RepID=UPI002D2AF847|nr:GNAT family N-acetyltransferase [Noviherbaspirillum sp.]HYD94179.1 GNAT family N-acetyltransferase [Noviherbaspirillum sp.]
MRIEPAQRASRQAPHADPGRVEPASGRTEVVIHDNEIPAFAGPELDRLYGTLYSSLSYFRTCGGLDGASTYAARRNDEIRALFLFRRDAHKVTVINEGMRVPAEEICRFARHMFFAYPSVRQVHFHAVQPDRGDIPMLHQRFFCSEDFITTLPATQDAFLARLGPATRKNLKRHRNRLERDFPDFCYRVHERGDATEADIRTILELNRQRMAVKGMATYINEEEAQSIVRLVQCCGAALVATIGGRICGGTLMYRIGENHLSKVNAHDPAYDDYRLGMLCCYLAISEAIACGARHFHLGHTHYDYKTALLGQWQRFDHIAIYRSPLALLGSGRDALKIARDGYKLRATRWFTDNANRKHSVPWRLARKLLEVRRTTKRRLQA